MERAIANTVGLPAVHQPADAHAASSGPEAHRNGGYYHKGTDAIDKEIADLEERVNKLRRLQKLRNEVNELQSGMFITADDEAIVQAITKTVCGYYNVRVDMVKAAKRPGYLVEPRHLIWALSKKYTALSYGEIGAFFNRNHSSIMYGEQRIRDLKLEPKLKQKLDRAEELVLEEFSKSKIVWKRQ